MNSIFKFSTPELSTNANARDNYFQRLFLERKLIELFSGDALQGFPREFAKNESFPNHFPTAAFCSRIFTADECSTWYGFDFRSGSVYFFLVKAVLQHSGFEEEAVVLSLEIDPWEKFERFYELHHSTRFLSRQIAFFSD